MTKLNIQQLPQLTVDDISNLTSILNGKAEKLNSSLITAENVNKQYAYKVIEDPENAGSYIIQYSVISGGGADLSDYYTKNEVDNLIPDISEKADANTVYTKTEVDTKFSELTEIGNIVGSVDTKADLDTLEDVPDNSIYIVEEDESKNDITTMYRYSEEVWTYIGKFTVDISSKLDKLDLEEDNDRYYALKNNQFELVNVKRYTISITGADSTKIINNIWDLTLDLKENTTIHEGFVDFYINGLLCNISDYTINFETKKLTVNNTYTLTDNDILKVIYWDSI
jgi:hypothetical protein